MRLKPILSAGAIMFSIFLAFSWVAHRKIESFSGPFLYESPGEVPVQKTALILGTSKTLKNGRANLYFRHRIDAAAELFKSGRVTRLIVSGDNSHHDYNEPEDMREALILKGVPDSVIHADYAGLRTFDSMIRVKQIFRQDSIIVVSQKFHNERAVYIARRNGLTAYGFNARDVDSYNGFKTKLREYLARSKVFIDEWIGASPRHLGESVPIR